jgi:hypothetical protein
MSSLVAAAMTEFSMPISIIPESEADTDTDPDPEAEAEADPDPEAGND